MKSYTIRCICGFRGVTTLGTKLNPICPMCKNTTGKKTFKGNLSMWHSIKDLEKTYNIPKNDLVNFCKVTCPASVIDNKISNWNVDILLRNFREWKNSGIQQIKDMFIQEAKKRASTDKSYSLREHLENIHKELKNEIRNSL